MPDLYFDVDAALTEVPVNILPLIDDTDFKTREIAIAYNAAGMDLVWNFVTSAGVFTQTAVTPTTAGVYDWTHQGDGMYTIEIPASGGASINNDTEGYGWFTGLVTGVLAWRGPIIGFRAAALNNALLDGGDLLDVNVTHIADTAQTANDNGADINAILADTLPLGYLGPHGYGVYIESGAANTNTVDGVDGIFSNPVSTFAAARTIANSIGVKTYYIGANSDLTLAATHEDWTFVGIGANTANIINLGSQDVDRSIFYNLVIEGTQGGTQRITAFQCALQDPGAGTTTLHIYAINCGIVDDVTLDTSNDNVFEGCYSLVAGTSAPIVRASGASGTLAIRNWSGGIDLRSLSASHNLSLEEVGQVIFDSSNNVNANVALRGIGTITDNTAGMANLSQDAFLNMSKINAEADTALVDFFVSSAQLVDDFWDEVLTGLTHNIINSGARLLRSIAGTIWTDGTAQSGTANTIQLASGDITIDGQYIRARIILIDGTGANQEAIITGSIAATDTVTITPAWIINPDNTTDYQIVPGQVNATTSDGGYDDGKVYVNFVTGSAGTIHRVNGTISKPSSVLADARTIANAVPSQYFDIKGGGNWILDQDYTNWIFDVTNAARVDLNGKDISGSVFYRTGVTGIGLSTTRVVFQLCGVFNATIGVCNFLNSGIGGTFTLSSEDSYFLWDCFQTTDTTPIIDVAGDGVTPTVVFLLNYSGNVELQNMTSVDKVYMSGQGHLTLNVNCLGGALTKSGDIKYTDNSGNVTITTGNIDDIIAGVNDLAVRKNAAFSNFEFLMVLASDGKTPATGLTVTGQRSIDAGAFANVSGVIAEVGNGIYQFDALAADTNGDLITWKFSAATADDTFVTFKTIP